MDKVKNSLQVEVPQGGFVDEGDGVISFPNGLTITDGSVQRNGTRYDIETLNISNYGGQLTGDHEDKLSSLIGETIGVVKRDGRVVVNKIRYAIKANPYARIAYDLLREGFSKNFSTETIGPQPDATNGVYWDAELVGLSQVVTQNNYNAHVNSFKEVVHNSLEQAKHDGLDVTGIEEKFVNNSAEEEQKMEEDKKTQVENVEVEDTTKKVADEETKTETNEEVEAEAEKAEEEAPKAPAVEEAGENGEKIVETPHVPETEETSEAQNKAEETNTQEAEVTENKKKDEEEEDNKDDKKSMKNESEDAKTEEVSEEEKETNKKEDKMDEDKKTVENSVTLTAEQLQDVISNALKPIAEKVSSLEAEAKNAFDKSAKEPEFKKEEEVAKNSIAEMDFEDRFNAHINAAWNYLQNGNIKSGETLREINEYNLNALKEAKIAKNSITIEDLGNFVIAPEMYNEIAGHRNDYTAILNATEWRETLSLEFAWLERVGDIDMQPVALNATEDDEDANLKPISEYSAVPRKSQLEELAAVTVVANSATRFAAVDLLADAAAGYRNDYDRKRAQLVIAKLEQAVDGTGYSTAYAPSADVDALTAWLDAVTDISDTTLNGTLIFNARTFAELKSRALKAGANGPLSEILTTGDLPTVFGYRFVIVPNDLMPSLDGSETIVHKIEGVNVPINHAVFFADLTTFTGRTSGGLQYDVSNDASYEVGGVTRSAYQRNELVLRGSFFRGGAVKDREVVSGIRQGAGANVS